MPSGPRIPIPPALTAAPFTVADGRSAGLGRGRLSRADLGRPLRGVRVVIPGQSDATPGLVGEIPLPTRCTAALLLLPEGSFLSHLTAARVWPLQLPRPVPGEPVHVTVPRAVRQPRRAGLAGHHLTDPHARVVLRGGLAVVDPATLFCQLASHLALADLVAVGDALVRRPVFDEPWSDRPWVPLGALTERVAVFAGRGRRVAAAAAELVRVGAESRPETLLRLALVDGGLPEPEVNVVITDPAGRFIARGDLVYRDWRLVVEYDGDQHRTSTAQFDRDVRRLEDLTSYGWRVLRVTGRSFFGDRNGVVERVAQALLAAGWPG